MQAGEWGCVPGQICYKRVFAARRSKISLWLSSERDSPGQEGCAWRRQGLDRFGGQSLLLLLLKFHTLATRYFNGNEKLCRRTTWISSEWQKNDRLILRFIFSSIILKCRIMVNWFNQVLTSGKKGRTKRMTIFFSLFLQFVIIIKQQHSYL